jgi:RND family efflux transporter MFP subunit
MDDKSALLKQLRIDRGSPQDSVPNSRRWWVVGAVVVLLLLAGAAFLFLRPSGVTVRAATAAVGPGGPAASPSLLDASGYVVARRQATVSAKITGKVTELLIEEGLHVDEGQVVARLDDTNVRASFGQARAQLEYARAAHDQLRVQLANAQRDYERKKQLLAEHYVSQSDLDLAQTAYEDLQAQLATAARNVEVAGQGVQVAQRNLDDTVVRAPFSGVITVKAAQPGEIVSPFTAGGGFTRTGIGTIVDMDSLEVDVDVNEAYIGRVQPDMPAEAVLDAYPDWTIPAHVIAIVPAADRGKATVKVRVALEKKDPRIVPDMGVRVSFLEQQADAVAQTPTGVLLPPAAIARREGHAVVFVLDGGHVRQRVVQPLEAGAMKRLTDGVSAGESVVLDPPATLRDGMAVRVAQAASP